MKPQFYIIFIIFLIGVIGAGLHHVYKSGGMAERLKTLEAQEEQFKKFLEASQGADNKRVSEHTEAVRIEYKYKTIIKEVANENPESCLNQSIDITTLSSLQNAHNL